jgi:MoaA/NifB/PqqE/SkfB family radical SAM enzyme
MDYKKLYAVITYDCNLHCPHCDTRGQQFEFNEEKFLSEITRGYKEVTLFGGEPLLYKDRVKKCLSTGVVTALSTNLLLMNEEIQCLCLQSNVAISTSWNHGRFTPEQYQV